MTVEFNISGSELLVSITHDNFYFWPMYLQSESLKALSINVVLQCSQGCLITDDSGADTENVSSSNVREFDGGIIAHAGGDGGLGWGWHWTAAFDEHPAAIIKLALQSNILSFCICEFLCVFSIQCSDLILPGLHIFDGGVRQAEILSGFIALVFVCDGVAAVVINRPDHGNQQADNDSTDDWC